MIETAKSEIVIESPYLVPSGSMLTLLEKKLREGVRVRIVTNSLRSCDGALPFAGYIKYRRRMVRDGIDLREYRGPDTLHAKTLVIDGKTMLVGSYNIDPRSANLNTEVMCVAEDETLAKQLLASIDHHINHAWTVGARERRPPVLLARRAHGASAHGRRGWFCRCLKGSCNHHVLIRGSCTSTAPTASSHAFSLPGVCSVTSATQSSPARSRSVWA